MPKKKTMIQRVQSIYILVTLIALITVTIGADVFINQVSKNGVFQLTTHANSFGVQRDVVIEGELNSDDAALIKETIEKIEVPKENLKEIVTFYFPFFSVGILLSLLASLTLFSFKKLDRQIKFGRLLFIFNFLVFGTTLVLYYLLSQETSELTNDYTVSTQLGFGFYCIVIAVAFSFLANIGIRRDIKLLKSIDRIR